MTGRLFLLPWHVGDRGDLTVHTLRRLQGLRVLLVEDPATVRRELSQVLPGGAAGKRLLRLPPGPDAAFERRVRAVLEREDVGLLASGGTPCFCDPGAWMVQHLRAAGVPIVPLAGPSALTALLSASGVEWTGKAGNTFTFAFFCRPARGRVAPAMRAALARREEPVVLFLPVADLPDCLRCLAAAGGDDRRVSVFFDLTKTDERRFPFANCVRTLTVREWRRLHRHIPWSRVSEIALIAHRLDSPRR